MNINPNEKVVMQVIRETDVDYILSVLAQAKARLEEQEIKIIQLERELVEARRWNKQCLI